MKIVTYEIVLSGDHPDMFVIFDAPDNLTQSELLEKAIEAVTWKTYIFERKVKERI